MSPQGQSETQSHASMIIEKRLLIVTGKGGTGKTTVAAAVAHAAQQRGRRVLLAETGSEECLASLIAPGEEPVGYAGRELLPGLTVMRIDPREALAEYLGLQIGLRSLLDPILNSQSFVQLMEATPGWRELITLGKIWHLQQMQVASGARRYDLIIVDAPATGHGLTFLDVPRVVASAVQSGPLRRNAAMVGAMVRDRENTLLVPVTLAEELPVEETAELVTRARNQVGIQVGPVVVNAAVPNPTPPGLESLDRRLSQLPQNELLGGLPPASTLASCAKKIIARHQLHQKYIDKMKTEYEDNIIVLPLLQAGIRGLSDIEKLGTLLTEPLTLQANP